MGTFFFAEHQHKGRVYVAALEAAGHVRMTHRQRADFIFFDHDIGVRGVGFRRGLDFAHQNEKPVFIIPHSARPNVMADTHKPWPHTKALFSISEGHKEIMEILKYPCPMEISGWIYSDIRPFQASEPQGKIKVLFAPIHPNNNGFLDKEDQRLNAQIFTLLVNMEEIELTIRHIHPLDQNGIWWDKRAIYVEGKPDGTTTEIEAADVVIGAYTLAYITVALGKPLVMMGEQIRPHVGNTPGMVFYSPNWEAYREVMRYPFEIEDVLYSYDQALEMLNTAMAGSGAVEKWKEKFIGKPFVAADFTNKVNQYLEKGY